MLKQAYGNTKLARRLLWLTGYADAILVFTSLCVTASRTANLLWLLVVLALANLVVGWFVLSQGVLFEWFAEKNFKEVCKGLGFEAEVRSFKYGLWGAFVKGDKKMAQPDLRCVRGNGQAFTGLITPLGGQKLEDYTNEAEAFALAFNMPFAAFERTPGGYILMRAGQVQVPEAYEYEELPGAAVPSFDVGSVLQEVPMAKDINGNPVYMPIEGNHLLIVGRTGAGKGSWVWSLVFGLREARAAGFVRLWGLDPKRVELAFGREWWDEYADTVEGMVELLERAVRELLDRNTAIQGKDRKITPSPAMPLNVIVIDELAYLSAMVTDKKLKDRAQMAIGTILVLGRATGYVLVGCSQDPRKDVLSFRDYFPTKVALGMEAPMVDLVLGEGAHEAGALCEQIPLRAAGAGCAFIKDEMTSKPVLVRAAWCSDQAIRMMMANPRAFGVQLREDLPVRSEQTYQQGYVQQSSFDNQPVQQRQYNQE